MHAVYYEKLNIVLCDYKTRTVQTPKITAYLKNDHCFDCFWSTRLYLTDLNFRTQTVPRRFYRLQ